MFVLKIKQYFPIGYTGDFSGVVTIMRIMNLLTNLHPFALKIGQGDIVHDSSFPGIRSINRMDELNSFVRSGTIGPRSNRYHGTAVIWSVLSFELMNMTEVGCRLETNRQFEFPF